MKVVQIRYQGIYRYFNLKFDQTPCSFLVAGHKGSLLLPSKYPILGSLLVYLKTHVASGQVPGEASVHYRQRPLFNLGQRTGFIHSSSQ